ncbi:TetR family transcriptional regulator C-terminal domain-containing protein [Flavicella marina]|uniref:TetR family transcriptional regulator C-terminal domain-containing protein n=1 Tax=Flavicella marina TaxID=1475951 RepID=UPI0012654363|nr:TetR family transcriptional regulator C-terminal domain-containing protein [Flavicella marina]
MKKTTETTSDKIISEYMDTVLVNGKNPESIYQFSKKMNIEESEFYKHFSSFEQIENEIFSLFSENSIKLLEKNKDFNKFTSKDKLLSFYYTFFENLTANRSYVFFALNGFDSKLQSFKKLSKMKETFIEFVNTLEVERINLTQEKLQKIQNKGIEEGFWIQLLLTLKFWMKDTSPSFEKTDIFIEKSIHASFEAMNTKPVKSIIDFGKFILKENMNFKL